MRDHPVIENCERTGYPDGKEPDYPVCPVCFRECESIFFSADAEVLGCDECITSKDAWDVEECFPGKE